VATFGNTTAQASVGWCGANGKGVNLFTLSEAASVTSMSMYLSGSATAGTQTIKFVIYDDDGAASAPGTLLGTSEEGSVAQNAAASWVTLNFTTPVVLAAGNYYLGRLHGTTANIVSYYYIASGTLYYNNDTYSDGAANPFGAPSTATQLMSVYATYELPKSQTPLLQFGIA
jgi:hypothetical protein